MATQWFYQQGGAKYGPVDTASLKELARKGELGPEDLLWKEGMAEWRPAKEAKRLFEGVPSATPAASVAIATDQGADAATADDGEAGTPGPKDKVISAVGPAVLVATATAVVLHALQWLFGWGWGSLWAVISTVAILSLGMFPLMWDREWVKRPAAAYGAGFGALLGAVYGWFTGGLLSGVLFCTSVGTWAAWVASLKGVTSKPALAGLIVAALAGFHFLGILGPRSSTGSAATQSVDKYFDEDMKRASRIQLGAEWANVTMLLGKPVTQQYTEEDVFVAKWPALRNGDKTFIAIVFQQERFGRPGLKRVWVEGVSIQVNGKEVYSLP